MQREIWERKEGETRGGGVERTGRKERGQKGRKREEEREGKRKINIYIEREGGEGERGGGERRGYGAEIEENKHIFRRVRRRLFDDRKLYLF